MNGLHGIENFNKIFDIKKRPADLRGEQFIGEKFFEILTGKQDEDETQQEYQRCKNDRLYWCENYVHIYDKITRKWILFKHWPEQARAQVELSEHQLLCLLKARQIGITWLILAYILHEGLFFPASTALCFNKRDDEAIEAVDFRIKGMFSRLPAWQKCKVVEDSKHTFAIEPKPGEVSRFKAMPTTAGRSYAANIIFIDEADHVPDLGKILMAVEPIIADDPSLQLFLASTSFKEKPITDFKKIWRAAGHGGSYYPIFLSWRANPNRTDDWYNDRAAKELAEVGSLDNLHAEFPNDPHEALAPNEQDKRLPYAHLKKVWWELDEIKKDDYIEYDFLRIYYEPEKNKEYVIGADTCEGNPHSDDSGFSINEILTGKQMAVCQGKYAPEILGDYAAKAAELYNNAQVLVERNNHGHAVLMWLRDNSNVMLIKGADKKQGWFTSSATKVYMYDQLAKSIREHDCEICDVNTFNQLASIERTTLRAPEGLPDDMAMAFAIANMARSLRSPGPRVW